MRGVYAAILLYLSFGFRVLTPLGVILGSQVCGRTLFDACLVFVSNMMHWARRRCVDWAQVRVAPNKQTFPL